MSAAGFYGKLAGRGDFIHRGLTPAFIEAWDRWLAAGMAESQAELGGAWLDAYLISPLWRFSIAPGLLVPEAVAGVMMPSIDRVGRYFPLTIAVALEPSCNSGALVGAPTPGSNRPRPCCCRPWSRRRTSMPSSAGSRPWARRRQAHG